MSQVLECDLKQQTGRCGDVRVAAVESVREVRVGSVVLPTASLLNHSCWPNAIFRYTNNTYLQQCSEANSIAITVEPPLSEHLCPKQFVLCSIVWISEIASISQWSWVHVAISCTCVSCCIIMQLPQSSKGIVMEMICGGLPSQCLDGFTQVHRKPGPGVCH